MRILVSSVIVLMLTACTGLMPVRDDVKSEFTFDYQIPGKTKDELWKSARDFFAGTYGDSRSVFRVMDQVDGTIIGKGTASWALLGNECITDYHVRFAAKDAKARLQFEIIRGVPPLSKCQGWPWPTEDGYNEIVNSCMLVSIGLEASLRGEGNSNKLKDF